MIYIILLVLISLAGCAFLYKQVIYNRKYFVIVAFFLMAITLGLRGNMVGEDTLHYIHIFDVIKKLSWKTVLTSFSGVVWDPIWGQTVEYLYGVLNRFISIFASDAQVLLMVVAILTCGLYGRFVYHKVPRHVFLATIIFLCDSLFMNSFNGMRQMLASSIIINAIEPMEKKEYKKVVGITIVAMFIHLSAVTVIPILFLYYVKNQKKCIKITFIASVVALFSINVLMQVVSRLLPRYAIYFQTQYWDVQVGGTVLIWLVEIYICVFLYIKSIKTNDEMIAICGIIVCIVCELLSLRINAFSRITYYYRAFAIMLIPSFIERTSKKNRIVYLFLIITLLLLEFRSYAMQPARMYSFFWQ